MRLSEVEFPGLDEGSGGGGTLLVRAVLQKGGRLEVEPEGVLKTG